MYYLTVTAKRKNAKRHITSTHNNIKALEQHAKFIDSNRYNVEIYNGKWEFVKEI
jgi:hypothetical protein